MVKALVTPLTMVAKVLVVVLSVFELIVLAPVVATTPLTIEVKV